MKSSIFPDGDDIQAQAFFMGQSLIMHGLEKTQHRVATSPFVIRAGENGYAVLFRYGVVVLFGLNAMEQPSFLSDLENFIIDPFDEPETDDITIKIDKRKADGIDFETIHLKKWEIEHLQIIAEIMAESVVLRHYESRMSIIFDHMAPITDEMQSGKLRNKHARELLRYIGLTLSIQRNMIGHVEIEEKPELLWEQPEMERFFLHLEDEYEISERHTILESKLALVHRTAETILSMMQEKRTLHVEWYIVILIVIEVILTMAEMVSDKF